MYLTAICSESPKLHNWKDEQNNIVMAIWLWSEGLLLQLYSMVSYGSTCIQDIPI